MDSERRTCLELGRTRDHIRHAVEAGRWATYGEQAVVVIAAVQQRLLLPNRLRDVLHRAGRVRHRRLLLAVIGDVEGGVHASLNPTSLDSAAVTTFLDRYGSIDAETPLDACVISTSASAAATDVDVVAA